MEIKELQSKIIAFLRFPLIVGVVMIHAQFLEVPIKGEQIDVNEFCWLNGTMRLLSQQICSICVPLFFFISGFLYFNVGSDFSESLYLKKTKSRIRSLVIPYLLWNTLVIGLFYFAYLIYPNMMSGLNKPIVDYSWQDWLWVYWNKDKINGFTEIGGPIALQFWFIRDLFIICLFSPLIFLFLKHLGMGVIALLFFLNLFEILPIIPGFNRNAWMFFPLGAYFSIKGFPFICKSILYKWIMFVVYMVTSIVIFLVDNCEYDNCLWYLNIVSGMFLVINIVAYGISNYKWTMPKFLSDSSFFIFAYHAIPGLVLTRLSFKIFGPDTDVELLLIYLVCPVINVLFGLLLYYLLKKYLPRFTAIITGGR